MIGNIKRLVNEHQTLIAVIISVLVISFIGIYTVKINHWGKGGDVIKIPLTFTNRLSSIPIDCLLVKMSNANYPLVILSEKGECKYKNNDIINNYSLFNYLFLNNTTFKNVVSHPMQRFKPDVNGVAFFQVFGNNANTQGTIYDTRMSLLNANSFTNFPDNNNFIKFDFEHLINTADCLNGDDNTKNKILENYNDLLQLTDSLDLFNRAEYIGQKAYGSINVKTISSISDSFQLSKNTRPTDQYGSKAQLYEDCKTYARGWFSNTAFANMLTKKYKSIYVKNNSASNRIGMLTGTNFTDYEVADIYPACKVAMTVLIILVVGINQNFNEQKIFDMIASYLLFVHLLNSFCGVRMYNSWNKHIGNEFVYKTNNINGQKNSMEINWEVFDIKDTETTANSFYDKKIPANSMQQGLKNSHIPASGLKGWANVYKNAALEKEFGAQFSLKPINFSSVNKIFQSKPVDIIEEKCNTREAKAIGASAEEFRKVEHLILNVDIYLEFKRKCALANEEGVGASFGEFKEFIHELSIDEYICSKRYKWLPNDAIQLTIFYRGKNFCDFMSEGLMLADAFELNSLYESLEVEIARLHEKTTFYSGVEIPQEIENYNFTVECDVKTKKPKFLPQHKDVIKYYMTNQSFLERYTTDDARYNVLSRKIFNKSVTPKKIRDEWVNYLKPIASHVWSSDQLDILFREYQEKGPRWDLIASKLENITFKPSPTEVKEKFLVESKHRLFSLGTNNTFLKSRECIDLRNDFDTNLSRLETLTNFKVMIDSLGYKERLENLRLIVDTVR